MKTVSSYVLVALASFGITGCGPKWCEEMAKNNPGIYQTPYCSAYAPDGAGGTPSFGGSGTGGSLASGGSEASAGSAGTAGEASSGGSNAEGGAESGGSGGSDPNGTALGGDGSGGAEPGSGGTESLGGSASGGSSGIESSGGTESSGGSESSGGATSAPCIPSGQQCSDQSVCCTEGDVCASGFCQNPSQGQGGGGSGGSSATGGVSSGGVGGSNGGTSGGGTGGVAGAAGSTSVIEPLVIEYLGPSPNLGTVSCGVWTGADPRDSTDPLNTLPGYGTYRFTNLTSTDIKEFWLFFYMKPFYPNGLPSKYPGQTGSFNYFNYVDLELSNMTQHSSTGLGGAKLVSGTTDVGESRSQFYNNQVPTIVIPANGSVEMKITSTLCPYVKWIPDPGTPEHYIPDLGDQVSMCIHQFRVGSFLGTVKGNPCFDNMRTYGGT